MDVAIADSGATASFLQPTAPYTCIDNNAFNNIVVGLPNGDTLKTSHTCEINLPQLPKQARKAFILPGLSNHSLLSIGTLCDADCEAKFTKTQVIISHNQQPILQGWRDMKTSLWNIPLTNNNNNHTIQAILPVSTKKTHIVLSHYIVQSGKIYITPGDQKWIFQNMARIKLRKCFQIPYPDYGISSRTSGSNTKIKS